MVARATARSRGRRQADSTGVEPRSTRDQDTPPGAIGRSPVGARQEACQRASVPTRAASSCRSGGHPTAGELPARADRDRPRSFRVPPIGHPLRHARCADLSATRRSPAVRWPSRPGDPRAPCVRAPRRYRPGSRSCRAGVFHPRARAAARAACPSRSRGAHQARDGALVGRPRHGP
jgi:hypothetical protein